jgi:hypothetical protein
MAKDLRVDGRPRQVAYLSEVRKRPCLVCGTRIRIQAHHVRIAIPKRLGKRVPDKWCVPLCFFCHSALHHFGDERTWWDIKGEDPIEWCCQNFQAWRKGRAGR